MDGLEVHEYQPSYSAEEGMNFSLYYCPLCDGDTLHQVLEVDFDNYYVKCSVCDTTSVTKSDYFDLYEEEAMRWNREIGALLPDGERDI